jgi:hypothetical protein
MQNDLTESVQASIRPGEMVDVMYAGETNIEKQAYPAVVNTRFVQQFTNLGQGSSQFVLSPNGGISDIILQMATPAAGTYTNAALPTGWGYSLLNRVSVRYGSSAQYFFSGPQVWLQNVLDAENNTKVDQLAQIGGNAATGGGCGGQTAYVYLKLPHNSCRAAGKPLPFPSDLLVQPIVITVELFALNQVLVNQGAGGGILSAAPTSLASASLQAKQEMLTDSSDQLARRVDMNSHAYTFPLPYFCQQETQVAIAGAGTQSVNLTGFRAGEVKQIVLWYTNTTAAGGTGATVPGSGNYQPLLWQQMLDVQLTYNGEIFNRFDAGSAQLWNIVEDQKSAVVNNMSVPNYTTAGSTATTMYYVKCDFAQVNSPSGRDSTLIHGKPILNAVVQFQFTAPAAGVLHAMYLYNSSLLCSRGSAEYIF